MFKMSAHRLLPLTLGQSNKNVMISAFVKHEWVATQCSHDLENH